MKKNSFKPYFKLGISKTFAHPVQYVLCLILLIGSFITMGIAGTVSTIDKHSVVSDNLGQYAGQTFLIQENRKGRNYLPKSFCFKEDGSRIKGFPVIASASYNSTYHLSYTLESFTEGCSILETPLSSHEDIMNNYVSTEEKAYYPIAMSSQQIDYLEKETGKTITIGEEVPFHFGGIVVGMEDYEFGYSFVLVDIFECDDVVVDDENSVYVSKFMYPAIVPDDAYYANHSNGFVNEDTPDAIEKVLEEYFKNSSTLLGDNEDYVRLKETLTSSCTSVSAVEEKYNTTFTTEALAKENGGLFYSSSLPTGNTEILLNSDEVYNILKEKDSLSLPFLNDLPLQDGDSNIVNVTGYYGYYDEEGNKTIMTSLLLSDSFYRQIETMVEENWCLSNTNFLYLYPVEYVLEQSDLLFDRMWYITGIDFFSFVVEANNVESLTRFLFIVSLIASGLCLLLSLIYMNIINTQLEEEYEVLKYWGIKQREMVPVFSTLLLTTLPAFAVYLVSIFPIVNHICTVMKNNFLSYGGIMNYHLGFTFLYPSLLLIGFVLLTLVCIYLLLKWKKKHEKHLVDKR